MKYKIPLDRNQGRLLGIMFLRSAAVRQVYPMSGQPTSETISMKRTADGMETSPADCESNSTNENESKRLKTMSDPRLRDPRLKPKEASPNVASATQKETQEPSGNAPTVVEKSPSISGVQKVVNSSASTAIPVSITATPVLEKQTSSSLTNQSKSDSPVNKQTCVSEKETSSRMAFIQQHSATSNATVASSIEAQPKPSSTPAAAGDKEPPSVVRTDSSRPSLENNPASIAIPTFITKETLEKDKRPSTVITQPAAALQQPHTENLTEVDIFINKIKSMSNEEKRKVRLPDIAKQDFKEKFKFYQFIRGICQFC